MAGARGKSGFVGFVVLVALLVAVTPASTARFEEGAETLTYRWELEGVSGAIARLLRLLPTQGDGLMKLELAGGGRLSITFLATSEKASSNEFWKYETAVDLESWRSVLVRDSLRYGKKDRSKTFDLEELDVTDVLSGLHLLRLGPLDEAERRSLWSSGKTYQVLVTPEGKELRTVADQRMTVRKLSIAGVRVPGQKRWKARAEVWLSDDEAALPVELVYHQSLGRLRMTLVDWTP